MSQADQEKWDARYAGQDAAEAFQPSELLVLAVERVAGPGGEVQGLAALDLACGGGRNSIYLAERGFQVDAVDVSAQGLALGRQREWLRSNLGEGSGAPRPGAIRWIQADLDAGSPVSGPYDLVVMIRYLDLALLADAARMLRPGGLLVAELHMDPGDEEVAGPRNPAFLVGRGALAEAARGLTPMLHTEGIVEMGGGRREALARFVGSAP